MATQAPIMDRLNRTYNYSQRGTANLATGVSDPPGTVVARIVRIPRTSDGRLRVLDGDITYGITDDPVDESVQFVAGLTPEVNQGDNVALPADDDSFWSGELNYRSIGTDAGPFQNLTKDKVGRSSWYSAALVGTEMLAIVADSNTLSDVLVNATLLIEEEIIQRGTKSNWSDVEADWMLEADQ